MPTASKKHPLSVANGNYDSISCYDRCSNSSLQARSAPGTSPARVFIKPKTVPPGDNARRTSVIAAPSTLNNPRQAGPRRSSSLYHTGNSVYNAPGSKLPRSSTVVRHASLSAKSVASNGVNGGPCFLARAPAIRHDKTDAKKTTSMRISSPKNKENDPRPRVPMPKEKQTKANRVVPRKQYQILLDDPPNQLPRRKTFLMPKVEEHVQKYPVRRSCRSTLPSQRELSKRVVQKKASLPSLPTMVITHSPAFLEKKSIESTSQNEGIISTSEEIMISRQAHDAKPSPRPFLLPRNASTLPSSTSLSSILSLPSQILKHTPISAHVPISSSDSPCLSKARTKSIWTMLDEIKLIRAGGILSNADALIPDSSLHVLPLCKLRNDGHNTDFSPKQVPRTPVCSPSTPYHPAVPTARKGRRKTSSDLPPLPSITRALADVPNGPEADSPKKKATNNGEKHNWNLVDVKKSQRRSTVSAITRSTTSAAFGGYGIRFKAHGATQQAKPSLLTRAQTLVKFKLPGSKKVVGRGDPNWT